MIGSFLIVVFAILSLALNAQEFTIIEDPARSCATPQIDRADVAQMFADLEKQNPPLYDYFSQKDVQLRKFNAANSVMQQFWALKISGEPIKPEDFYPVVATLRKEGNAIRIWVEDESWSAGYVTQTEVEIVFDALTLSTPPGSMDPNKGIVEIDTMLFGQPPNKAGDGVTNFLILDIQDTYDPEGGNKAFVAGYFFPNDQSDDSKSNKMDLLYIDAFPGIFFNGERRTKTVLATTAHELQHLIHYRYDRLEENWVNEGLSELSSTVCGYGIGNPSLFLQDTNRDLTGWSNELEDYSRVGLWTLYTLEQLGYEFIQKLTRNTARGISGFNNALAEAGYSGPGFETIFRDWTIANYVNDMNNDPRYGYQHEEVKALKASVTADVFNFPQLVNVDLERYAARYIGLGGEDTLEIEFFTTLFNGVLTRQSPGGAEIIPLQENPLIYPEFNKDDDFALVLNNSGNAFEYEFCAYAPFSLTNIEQGYDDGALNIALTSTGIAANKFVVPQNGLSPEKITFFNLHANAPLTIHLYEASGGFPGNHLIPPVDTAFGATNVWIEIPLREEIPPQNAGDVIFAGIEADTFAYDSDSNGDGNSYFYTPQSNWRLLSDFEAGGNTLTGSWMIRALFRGGLVASGPKGCSPTQVSNFAISKIYPNPSRGSISLRAEIGSPGEVVLTLYNVLGEKVSEYRQTFADAVKSSVIHWVNIETFYEQPPASGIYFLRAVFEDAETQKTETADVQKVVMVR
jgi:hypothetical protein